MSEDLGHKLDKVDLAMLGQCKKVTVTKDDTILLHGAGDKPKIAARCDQLKASIEATTSDYDRDKLQERLAKLSGGWCGLEGEGGGVWVGKGGPGPRAHVGWWGGAEKRGDPGGGGICVWGCETGVGGRLRGNGPGGGGAGGGEVRVGGGCVGLCSLV